MFKNDEKADYTDNCLLYALKMGGLDDVKYEAAKTYIKTAHVTKKALHKLCEKLDIVIELETVEKDQNRKTIIGSCQEAITTRGGLKTSSYPYYISKKSGKFFELGLIDGHFFLNEQVPCTAYAMENYNTLKHMNNWNQIYRYEISRKRYKLDEKRFTSSFSIIQNMMNQFNKNPVNALVSQITEKTRAQTCLITSCSTLILVFQ